MPYTPKESKKFLEGLIERRTLPFQEVLGMFADDKGRISRPKLEAMLTTLWLEDTFVLVDRDGAEVSWKEDTVYDSPADYTVRFVSIAGKENSFAARFRDQIDADDIDEIEPGYCWAGVKRREPIRIFGDRGNAMLLAERIRAFSHYFAFHLVSSRHERLEGLFSTRAAGGQTLDDLIRRISEVEKEYGPFNYFDHVEVLSVYPGDPTLVSASAQMKLPKDVARSEQRGEARFQIVSVCTPNGMFVHEYTVQLAVIEEDGFFRILSASVFSGY